MPRPRKGTERSREDIRRIVRRHKLYGESITAIARDEEISRATVYQYLENAERDPEGAFEEARAELEFRREMYEMAGD